MGYSILNIIETMGKVTNYNFISNNVKGMQASKKRLKLFEYLKQNVNFNGFILFQQTHSSINDEKQWKDELRFERYFSHHRENYFERYFSHHRENSDLLIQWLKKKKENVIY